MKKEMGLAFLLLGTFGLLAVMSGFLGYQIGVHTDTADGPLFQVDVSRPLDKYTIEALAASEPQPGRFTKLDDELFSLSFDPTLGEEQTKQTTGQVKVPEEDGEFPVVLMLRGFVSQEIYKTGMGSERAAEVFSKNGFITVSPDFLGYGGSDSESADVFETRFQTYTTALSTVASFRDQSFSQLTDGKWDGKNIFIWAHSNGGQVATTVLEATGASFPTTMWAPVTKPFPYSILYYTDEAADGGQFLRGELAIFEDKYEAALYSPSEYLGLINAPVQLHQGTADDAVPVAWTNAFERDLEEAGVETTYYVYEGADHNMIPDWNSVVSRDIAFFREHLK